MNNSDDLSIQINIRTVTIHRTKHRHSLASTRSQCKKTGAPSEPSSHTIPTARAGRTDARYSNLLSLDENLTHSLLAKAASAQQTQLYIDFVLSAYPCYFKATETRVPINWVEYVDSRKGRDSPFDWAVRCLTTSYTGSLYNDPRYVDAGRGLYMRALRGLSGLLNTMSTAKSDDALATAISLAVFEMHSCTTADGWINHASGIRALMRLRGPASHLHGFGRALYIAYRNTLVTSALVTGENCFLEEPEWQFLNKQIATENAKQPDSSVYTDITERAFREIVKLPGLVQRSALLARRKDTHDHFKLLDEVLATRAALRGIHTEFSMTVSTLRAGREMCERFIGPIPHHFFDGYSALSMQGIRSATVILNYLVIILDPAQRVPAEAENRIIADRTQDGKGPRLPASLPASSSPRSVGPRLVVESKINPETRESLATDWMDRIAITVGMEGVRINLVED
jgi:hypothetical protein